MRVKPPRLGEILAGAFGALLLVSLFLPWYGKEAGYCIQVAGASCPPETVPDTAWEAFAVLDLAVLGLALAALGLLVSQTTQRTPAIPVAWGALTVPLGLVVTVWVLVRTLSPPGEGLDPLFAFMGLVASAGVTVGALLSIRDEGFGVRPKPGIGATMRGVAPGGADAEPLSVPQVAAHRGGDPDR